MLVDSHTDYMAFDHVQLGGPMSRVAGLAAPVWIIDPQDDTATNALQVALADETLDRVTDMTGPVARYTRVQLERARIKGCDETLQKLSRYVRRHMRAKVIGVASDRSSESGAMKYGTATNHRT